ncbi:ABC transporter permease [Acidocella aromatica]|uniref:Simple sugar transport system permease protein n=1 Tax=Acidocella aromatica TaxID=1303579 RepID=A0A840V934_9PROT|nr:ABC transporter permease [Acidocella aromatica]MBB5372256.1 simple sugar transport system permease protein [Acidocella aromatica]
MIATLLAAWAATIPAFAAPFLLATVGLIINERAGVMNLGAEGIMAIAAVVSVLISLDGGGVGVALLGGVAAGLVLTAVFAVLAVLLRVDQVLAGLVTFALGIGISGYVGDGYDNQTIPGLSALPTSLFGWMPKTLAGVLDQDVLTYVAFGIAVLVWYIIEHTDLGLRLRAVGEDAPAADAAGVNVALYRLGAVLAGGVLCAVAGAHLSLVGSHLWVDGMVAGRGWIAVAMVTLARWNALRAIAAALLFGAIQALVPQLLSSGLNVPVYFIEMSPYLATLAYLLLAGMFANGADAQPVDLGRPYLREERR